VKELLIEAADEIAANGNTYTDAHEKRQQDLIARLRGSAIIAAAIRAEKEKK
jgi:hypothetical protein